jgi:RNA-directed DNA polymerase
VNANPKQRWLREAVEKRLREELGKLEVEVNEDRTYRAELSRGESFGFLNLRKVVPNAFPVLVA